MGLENIYKSPSPGFLRLVWAKDFYDTQENKIFSSGKNVLEKTGHCLRWGIGSGIDFCLRNYNNPIVIVALTALVMFAVTIAFYPATAWTMLVAVLPFAAKITSAMLLFATYLSVQLTLLGIGLRAIGRLNNEELMQKYTSGSLQPLYPGSKTNSLKA